MTPGDAARFGQAFGTMAEVFERKITPLITKAYFQALIDHPIEHVEAAISQAIATGRYFPRPAELRERISPVISQHEALETIARQQVAVVLDQIRTIGSYGTPSFTDPITADLMSRRYAWRGLCAKTEKELEWWAKDFIQAYESQTKAPMLTGAVKALIGGIGNGVRDVLPAPTGSVHVFPPEVATGKRSKAVAHES